MRTTLENCEFLFKVRSIDDVGGKTFCFEVYNDKNEIVKAAKTDSKGTVVPGNHTRYRSVYCEI